MGPWLQNSERPEKHLLDNWTRQLLTNSPHADHRPTGHLPGTCTHGPLLLTLWLYRSHRGCRTKQEGLYMLNLHGDTLKIYYIFCDTLTLIYKSFWPSDIKWYRLAYPRPGPNHKIHDLKPYNFAPNHTIFWSNHTILFQTIQMSF